MSVTFRYWEARSGHPQRVYINSPGHPQLYGQHIRPNKIAWGGEGLTKEDAERLAFALLPSASPDWNQLLAWAHKAPQPAQRANGSFYSGGRKGPQFGAKGTTLPEIAGRRSPYTALDASALNPYEMAHPLPEPTKLLVDHREPARIAEALARVPNLDVEITTLEIGDYVVPDRFIIERKTTSDFQASIVADAKRVFHQTQAIAMSGLPSLLIIEGGACAMQSMKLNAIYGTLTFISLIQKIPILETFDEHSTVYMIAKAIRHNCYGLGYDLGLRSGSGKKAAKEADKLATASFVLEGIPGVSAARARALLAHFGNIRAVALADVAALTAVAGIGKKTAIGIHEALNGGAEPL